MYEFPPDKATIISYNVLDSLVNFWGGGGALVQPLAKALPVMYNSPEAGGVIFGGMVYGVTVNCKVFDISAVFETPPMVAVVLTCMVCETAGANTNWFSK